MTDKAEFERLLDVYGFRCERFGQDLSTHARAQVVSAFAALASAPVADEHCSACNPQVFSIEQLEKDPLLVARLWRNPADTDRSLVERILEHVSEYGESMASSPLLSVRTIARRNLEARIEAELADAMRSQDESPLREALTEIASAWSARTRLPEEDGIQALKDIARAALASAPVAGPSDETLRLAGVIADKIEDGTLFQAGIFSRRDLAEKVRSVVRFAQISAPVAGQVVSVDVSTGDDDAGVRAFGTLTGEVNHSTNGDVWLAEGYLNNAPVAGEAQDWPTPAQEAEAAKQWDAWAHEMNQCRDASLEQAARICDAEGQEWDSDAVITEKNYAAHCARRIRTLKWSAAPQASEAVRSYTLDEVFGPLEALEIARSALMEIADLADVEADQRGVIVNRALTKIDKLTAAALSAQPGAQRTGGSDA